MASMLIALGSKALASYPEGAAMAVGFLQYPLGLRALGHQVAWIELISTAQLQAQPGLAAKFFALMARYGLAQDSVLVAVEDLGPSGIRAGRYLWHEPGKGRRA